MATPAVIVDATPSASELGSGWVATPLDELPSEPFALGHERLVVAVDVADGDTAAAVLLAVARGVAVVVSVGLPPAPAARFLDDLARVADVRRGEAAPALRGAAEEIQTGLLEALAEGLTIAAAGRRVGVSRRTAVRRLAEARRRLGAASTTEAVRIHIASRHRRFGP